MKTLDPIIIVAGAVFVAVISSAITAWHYRRIHRGQYNRGWNAGRDFQARQAHDHAVRLHADGSASYSPPPLKPSRPMPL